MSDLTVAASTAGTSRLAESKNPHAAVMPANRLTKSIRDSVTASVARVGRYGYRILVGGALVGLTTIVNAAPGHGAASITAADVVAQIQAGARIDLSEVTVTNGPLDLTPLGAVSVPLTCRRCTIDKGLVAHDVTFTRAIDLEDVKFLGPIDLQRATFEGPVLVRGDGGGARVDDVTNISQTRFALPASFDSVDFSGGLLAEGASFADDVSFSGAQMAASSTIARARFAKSADLSGVTVDGAFDASNAIFGDLDARTMRVSGPATFTRANAKTITFDSATFNCDLELGAISVSDRLVLRHVFLLDVGSTGTDTCRDPGVVGMNGIDVAKLAMDLTIVHHVVDPAGRRTALVGIEDFERASGSASTANDAHFALLSLDAEAKAGLDSQIDATYRIVGGYLVRPFSALRALALLVLLGTGARWLVDRWRDRRPARLAAKRAVVPTGALVMAGGPSTTPSPEPTPKKHPVVRAGRRITPWLDRVVRAVRAAIRVKPAIADPTGDEEPGPYVVALLALAEWMVSKVLIFTFLLALANYNKTLHDLIQGVFK
jgi:hypothetical protein